MPKKPTIKELAAEINIIKQELNSLLQATSTVVSVLTDYMKFKGDTEDFHNWVADNVEAPAMEE